MKTGKIVQGTVNDCNKKVFVQLLQNLDRQLYVKWNPEKLDGMGCWEIRRRPDRKTAVPKWELGDSIVFDLEYVENDLVNHVLDLPCLHYNAIEYLKSIDTWEVKNWVSDFEYREGKHLDKQKASNKNDLRYAVKHYKKAFADFQEHIRSGRSPVDFLEGEW